MRVRRSADCHHDLNFCASFQFGMSGKGVGDRDLAGLSMWKGIRCHTFRFRKRQI